MNDIKLNYNQDNQTSQTLPLAINRPARGFLRARAKERVEKLNDGSSLRQRSSILYSLSSSLCFAALLLAGGGCTLRQAYPETQIRGYINGQPFSINAPKDSNLTGFDASAETNGTVHVHIDSLQSTLNPTNLANAASGQAAIVTATGQAINQAISTATATALKAAGTP